MFSNGINIRNEALVKKTISNDFFLNLMYNIKYN